MKYKFGIHYRKDYRKGILGLYVKKWYGWKNVENQPLIFIKGNILDEQDRMIACYERYKK